MADGSALGLDPARETGGYVRQILKRLADDGAEVDTPLRIYEHKNQIFTVHGNRDIELVASCQLESLFSVESIHFRDQQPLPTLRLNKRLAADLVSLALARFGKKVEIWQRAGSTTTLRATGSPAHFEALDEFLTSAATASVAYSPIVAVKVASEGGTRKLGVAACENGGRLLSVGVFDEDEVFSRLEGIIISTGAKEVVFCANELSDYDAAKVSEMLSKSGAARTERKKGDFSAEYIEVDLRKLVGNSLEFVNYLDAKPAMSALACLIRFANLLEQPSLEGHISIKRIDDASCMRLDTALLDALQVFPKGGERGRSSLLGLLDRTKTALGSRLLRRWLSQPLQDKAEVESRFDLVEAFISDPTLRKRAREEHLRRVPDLSSLCRKFQKKTITASLQDVVRLYQFSARLPFLESLLSEHTDPAAQGLLQQKFGNTLHELVAELANFEALVETTIDLEQLDNHEFVINPNIDEALAELKEKKDETLAEISECYDTARRKLNLDSDRLKLEKKDNLGYFFRLTRKDEKLLRDKSAFTILETRKDGVRFSNNVLKRLSREYNSVAEEYESKQGDLKKKTLEVVATYLPVFEDCSRCIAELDVLLAFACVAADAPEMYTRPTMVQAGGALRVSKGRHPMVEECSPGKPFIANDVDLGTGENSERCGGMAIITGPNMGGKSTYIRTAGVITLMAHIGSFVPAESAQVPITDRILARVGAGDNQLRGVSTFMAEMLETAAILRGATSRSLIIIDELGRGTSTYDGFGLAYAISEHIVTKIGASCLFATHFHELTSLSSRCTNVKNLHVTATTNSEGKLVFLYEVREGACDESFGIHVAEIAGFPEKLILSAKRKAAELEESREELPAEGRLEGRKALRTFLGEFKQLDLAKMAPAEAVNEVVALKERVIPRGNQYLDALMKVAAG